jgi:hypothetical protein
MALINEVLNRNLGLASRVSLVFVSNAKIFQLKVYVLSL